MIQKGIDIKLNVKPIYIGLVHKYFFEGPCRMAPPEQLTHEFEAMMQPIMGNGSFEDVKAHLKDVKGINLLEPLYVERNDEMTTPEILFEQMMEDDAQTDLYLFTAVQMVRGDLIVEMAERTGKPVMIQPENCCMFARTISHVRSHGQEGYAPLYWNEAIDIMQGLRLRKVMAHSHLLQVTRLGDQAGADITSNAFYNPHEVTKILGTRFRTVNLHEVLDQFKPGDPMKNHTTPGREGLNPTEDDMKEIERITDEMIAGADLVAMKKEDIMTSVRLWYTVQKFLDKHDCNMFVAPCPQFCATRRANEEKVTFCLTHTLNNEIGIPSACEADTIAALSKQLLMSASGAATYMGETNSFLYYGDGIARAPFSPLTQDGLPNDEWKEGGLDKEDNLIFVFHSVPSRKFHGFDKPNSSYTIQPFAYSGWGATIRNNFNEDKGQVITLCRLSPDCKKIFIAKGTIMGGAYQNIPNCTHTLIFKVKDHKDFHDKQLDFGTHVPLTYGDHTAALKWFAKSAGLEVVEA